MFRVKLTVPPERVLQYIERVKTGIRGIGYVRLDDSVEWPERLNRQLPGPGPTSAATSRIAAGGRGALGHSGGGAADNGSDAGEGGHAEGCRRIVPKS